MSYHKLRRKLSRIEALEKGASTDGERIAAQKAKQRIQLRLRQSREDISLVDDKPFVEDLIFSSEMTPTRFDVIGKLKSWQNGDITQKDVISWARNVVDKVLFDEVPPEHPDSIPIEAIMICSAMDRRTWSEYDISALLEFVTSSPEDVSQAWKQWFAYVTVNF